MFVFHHSTNRPAADAYSRIVNVQGNEEMSANKEQHDQEQYDPEIEVISFKTKQSFQNCASAAVEQSLAIAPTTNNKKRLYEDYEDFTSIQGRFLWNLIAKIWVPVVIRAIDGKSHMFVSTRIAENLLLKKYLSHFNTDIYSCTSIRSYLMTNSEAILLNDINQKQCDFFFGNELLHGGEDYIVHLEDIQEFYTFLDICYKTLIRNINTGRKKKCGFLHINSESIVPYCKQGNLTFIPLFYFEGNTEDLKHRAEKVQKWNLPYFKFCCKIQGIRDHYFDSDSCLMASLDEIKNYYSADTHFKEFWPSRINNTRFLNNNISTNVSPPGSWFRKPPGVVCVIPLTSAPLAPVIRHSMPVMRNTNQNKRLANQMSSAMSQGSGLKNRIIHVVTSPPLDHASNTASVIGLIQCKKTIYNPMANSNMISHSNQMQQIYRQCSINNSQDQLLELQQQHIQQQQQQQPLQIKISQTQHSYSGHSEPGRLTNTQLHNPLRKVMLIIITPDTEIVDFSSLPSNHIPPTVLETFPCPIVQLKLRKIPELNETNNGNTAAFKIQKVTLQGKNFHCINLKPYIYSNLLATLHDIVRILLPSYTAARIAYILNKKFKITLFSGNSEQLAVLRENRLFGSIYSEYTPMALLCDIICVWEPLKKILMEEDQYIYQSAGESSKRRRTR